MARKLDRPRPKQGARLAALRRAAGRTQVELARLLGVEIEPIIEGELHQARRAGPVGKVQKISEEVSTLPRKQQERLVETVSALVAQYERGA